jgi:hypothetical protein
MISQDRRVHCSHTRVSHTNELGEGGTGCILPDCYCKKFLD